VQGALMVCGTGSDVGKSALVTGLCRILARRGVRVAPFKAQNMSLNSTVTADGAEIGRAQALQAAAAGIEPTAHMNPLLLKPSAEQRSQLIVLGQPSGTFDAPGYGERHQEMWSVVLDSLAALRAEFDVVLLEGAGGAAEINLVDRDLVNLPLARRAGVPAVLVGDIDRGGVFASLYGSVALLSDELRPLVKGFVINKLRGDPALLLDGPAELARRSGVPVLGVVPWLDGLDVDAEDSLALDRYDGGDGAFDVAVVRLPRISNFTDLDPLAAEPGVSVRFVRGPGQVGRPDLVIVPGTRATVADLAWLRSVGLDRAIRACGAPVLGICGGEQLLGRRIVDDVESGAGEVAGLGWLPVDTVFVEEKVLARRAGTAFGVPVHGYEIHHGRTAAADPWLVLGGVPAGSRSADGRVLGTALHGLFESDGFRDAFLRRLGGPGASMRFATVREAMIDRLADHLEAHVDLDAVVSLAESASPARRPPD
jgi:adenosylcobyric acid synthase